MKVNKWVIAASFIMAVLIIFQWLANHDLAIEQAEAKQVKHATCLIYQYESIHEFNCEITPKGADIKFGSNHAAKN